MHMAGEDALNTNSLSGLSEIHTRVKNNAWLDCSEHSDLNTLFESEMNPRKTKALTDRREETSSLNTSCFDYNCLRRTFCFHHWSVQHVTAHFERAQPAEEVKPTLPLLTEGSGVEGPARLVIQVDTQVPVIRHQMNLRFQSLRSRLRPYRARLVSGCPICQKLNIMSVHFVNSNRRLVRLVSPVAGF